MAAARKKKARFGDGEAQPLGKSGHTRGVLIHGDGAVKRIIDTALVEEESKTARSR
jgi:hypothetical protein